MIPTALLALLIAGQTPPPNPACTLLTTAQVASLVGAVNTTPISSNSMGSSCMLQGGDKIVSILIVNATTAEGAKRQFDSKKAIASAPDVPGLGVPAFAGVLKPKSAAFGILKGQTFTEVRVSDPTQTPDALIAKLKPILTEIAGRK